MIERMGIRVSVTFGMLLGTIGMWGMYIWNAESFGSIMVGSAQPFVINTFTKLSASWFGPKGRPIATMFLLISLFLPLAFSEYETT